MNAPLLKASDIKVFSDGAVAFFRQTTGKDALVRTAYLIDKPDAAVLNDFQGLIELGGKYRGSVVFSAPRSLLTHVLLVVGESDYSEASHRDIVGEIANQMAGYARRHFGETMDMSPPSVSGRSDAIPGTAAEGFSFVIPLLWDCYESHLVVRMASA